MSTDRKSLLTPERAIWDQIEERMQVVRRYDAFRTRFPWRWLPARVRHFAFKMKEQRHASRNR